MEGVGLDSFTSWSAAAPSRRDEAGKQQPAEASRFPVKKRVNQKLYFWVGPICRAATEVIVNTTSENFAERGGVSGAIFKSAGPELEKECATLEGCRTGEAKLTSGYRLPCKAVRVTLAAVPCSVTRPSPHAVYVCVSRRLFTRSAQSTTRNIRRPQVCGAPATGSAEPHA
jgi:hypothetical protein